jgi:hypothetical protein
MIFSVAMTKEQADEITIAAKYIYFIMTSDLAIKVEVSEGWQLVHPTPSNATI